MILLFWAVLLSGLLQYRLKSRIRRKTNLLLTVTVSRKKEKRIAVEQEDMRSLGWSSLIVLLAAIVTAMSVAELSFEGSFLFIYLNAVLTLSAVVSILLLLWIASILVANRSEHSVDETPRIFLWKVPLAIAYVLYRALSEYAQEHLTDVRFRWFS